MALTRPKYSNIVDGDYKASCRVVTTTDVTLSGGAPDTYDGVSLSAGDRILVAAQNTASENGIYIVQILGTGSDGTWIRSFDASQTGRLTAGAQLGIGEGTYGGTIWRLTTPDPIVIGTTALTWVSAGAGTPGGVDGQVQVNSGGVLAGASGLVYDAASGNLVIPAETVSGNVSTGSLVVDGGVGISRNMHIGEEINVGGNVVAGNLNTTGTANVSTLSVTQDAAVIGILSVGGDLSVTGNLTIDGTTTTLNTQTLTVEDLNITMANGAVDSSAANGAGITVDGASATILYASATDSWDFNKQVIGQFTTANLVATGGSIQDVNGSAVDWTATNFSSGNIYQSAADTFVATNFSSGNIYQSAADTFVATNFSSGNVDVTGGSVTGITGAATDLVVTNFSSGNALVTGGSLTGVTGAATDLVVTNFTTANGYITGSSSSVGILPDGAASLIANLYATLGFFTNMSTANAQVTGGAISGITDLAVADGGTGAGTAADARTNLSAFGRVNIQAFTSGTTYTPTAGAIGFLVILTGGGGGGGGADGADTAAGSGGGGGGGGGTAIMTYTAAEMGATATYAIGAGGTAGAAANGTSGTAGGNSSFNPAGTGATITANGGALGTGGGAPTVGAAGLGGIGGTASGGLVNVGGGDGGSGAGNDIAEYSMGGIGGGTFWGGGGRSGAVNAAGDSAGTTSTTPGSGGGGAASIDSTTGAAGGAGLAGILVVLEFLP